MGDTDLKRGLREARQNLKNGKVREALARLFHLTEKYPDDREVKGEIAVALLAQGRSHAERGKLDLAGEDFRRSIGYSETPDGHLHLGRLLQARGELEDAFIEYTRALEMDESSASTHEHLGHYFLDTQDFEQAVKAFGNALSSGAEGAEVYLGLWRAHMGQERPDRAHETAMDALKKLPDDAQVLLAAGLSSEAKRDTVSAEEYWLRSERAAGGTSEATFYLAGLFARRGDRQGALRRLKQCAAESIDRTKQLWKQDARLPVPRFGVHHHDEDFLDVFQ